jgi:hypothetical protein
MYMGRKMLAFIPVLSLMGQDIVVNHSFSTHILFLTEQSNEI